MGAQGKHAREAPQGEGVLQGEGTLQSEGVAHPQPRPLGTLRSEGVPEDDSVPQGKSMSQSESAPQSKGRRILRECVEILGIIVVAVILTTLLKAFVIDQYEIPTGSMEPTIEIGDRLFAEKVSYHFTTPTPGDIVTFNDPIEGGRVLIKRCIAVGGQTVDLIDGRVVVDGKALDEPYTHGKPSIALDQMVGVHFQYPYTVPEGSIWVMGDNRTNSLDSRYFGVVSQDELIGRALFRFLPLNRFGAIDEE
ncbi:MAG: signal peptidase I [Coriobacteriales bacterium]|jgi:signal peptidase I|nr:signal peptidase I [Coriobacteriales bacterium]